MLITKLFKIDQETFNNLKKNDYIPLDCSVCGQSYLRMKKYITDRYRKFNTYPMFCSDKCRATTQSKEKEVECTECGLKFFKKNSQILKSSTHFCNNSCRATYFNKNKTQGFRRSKMEVYLEECLTRDFKSLNILFSDRKTIGKELDIYIPSLNIAFEIQGIYHYKPIFGEEKLKQTIQNDKLKIKLCEELGIRLYQIDISSQNVFKNDSAEKYYNEIKKIIEDFYILQLPLHM